MTLHATLNPKSFLKSPGQELSEYIVYSSGEAIFLKFRSQGGVHSTFTYVLSKKKSHGVNLWLQTSIDWTVSCQI